MALSALVFFAAAELRIPARRVRALALGDERALHDWIVNESATRLAEARRDARVALERLQAVGGRFIALGDEQYPAGLRDLPDPPAWLTVRGTLRAERGGTAIVGTREPHELSRRMARELAGGAPPPIVSGLARGIDAAAHEGALAAGAPTYAYVATGLSLTYPPEHVSLAERIIAGGGCVLSELLPQEPVTRWSLVRRDRLQAAHAAALVLVQSESNGGAMHAMKVARVLDRPRFAFEPRGAAFAGNERALREGALSLPWDSARASAMVTLA